MAYPAIFKRYEIKYLLDEEQKKALLKAMEPYMRLDGYGRTTIRNIYFDTEDYRIIRRSLEKPAYKEKLRIRSYKAAESGDTVFAELKKKYNSVVYKRRLTLTEEQAENCFGNSLPLPVKSQIADEIDYFRSYYKDLRPSVFLSYEREAFYALDGSDFRITFDENILYRETELSMKSGIGGTPLLGRGKTLMEIKTSGGMPLWLSHSLNSLKVFPTSFSKYGRAFCDMSMKRERENKRSDFSAC